VGALYFLKKSDEVTVKFKYDRSRCWHIDFQGVCDAIYKAAKNIVGYEIDLLVNGSLLTIARKQKTHNCQKSDEKQV